MDLSLSQKQKKDVLNRYYTPDLISNTLIHSLQNISPKQIIELGVGQGALTKAAINRWISARFITIDLDPDAGHVSTKKRSQLNLTHFTADALQEDLHAQLGLELKSFDLAIGNPPFMKPEWRDHYSHILEDSGLSAAVSCHKEATSHILFLAQSLRLVRPEGKLGLILPDGIVSGEKNYSLRKNLLENHHIEQVIKLPSRAFSKTEAQTHLLILTKEGNQQSKTMLSSFNHEGKTSPPIFVDPKQGANRL